MLKVTVAELEFDTLKGNSNSETRKTFLLRLTYFLLRLTYGDARSIEGCSWNDGMNVLGLTAQESHSMGIYQDSNPLQSTGSLMIIVCPSSLRIVGGNLVRSCLVRLCLVRLRLVRLYSVASNHSVVSNWLHAIIGYIRQSVWSDSTQRLYRFFQLTLGDGERSCRV